MGRAQAGAVEEQVRKAASAGSEAAGTPPGGHSVVWELAPHSLVA